WMQMGGSRDEKTGVDAARQKRADRHVAAKVQADGVVETREDLGLDIVGGNRRLPPPRIKVPVLLFTDAALVQHQFVSTRKLAHRGPDGAGRDGVVKRQILIQRLRIDVPSDSRQPEERL